MRLAPAFDETSVRTQFLIEVLCPMPNFGKPHLEIKRVVYGL